MRAIVATLLLTTGLLFAQMQMNVEQLAEFIRSELALKQHSDKQIAAYVRKLELSEQLKDKTILDLQAQGAGPKTVEALRALRDQTANMKPPTHDSTYSPATAEQPAATGPATATLGSAAPPVPPPSSIRQQEILQSIKDYAANYTQHLPNFFCVEVTRQYVDPNAGSNYRSIGTILAKVSYNEGSEHYNVYSHNGKLTIDSDINNLRTGGARSTGEFGSLMREIFEPRSEAEFNWDHWATLRGRRMAVFNYFIDSGHSKWSISYGAGQNDDQRIITAYRGLIYADANTGEIGRIKFIAVDIPRSFPVTETSETLDYDLVEISGQQFVVPLRALLLMKAGRDASKNEIEFRNYRKFETGTNITYDLDPNATPPPLPDAATEEKPATTTTPSKRENPWLLPPSPPPPPPSH